MTIDTVADELDDLEPEEVEAPKRRRAGATLAQPAEAIPAELNSAFLEDLAFERALSTALGLASGLNGAVGGLGSVSGPEDPPELATAALPSAGTALERAISAASALR